MNDFTKNMAQALFNQDKINDLLRKELQQAVNDLYMIKKNEYHIFFSKSNSSLCILNGGARKKVNYSLEYFYKNIDKYVQNLEKAFRPYQSILNEIAFEIKQFLGDGNIHGSIVDIDYYHHVSRIYKLL